MSVFWRKWLVVWCWAVAIFGAVLALAGFDATKAPVEQLFLLFNPATSVPFDATARFAIGLMGAVTLGWGLTLLAGVRMALALGHEARPLWNGLILSVLAWYVLDGIISISTGFALNAVSNTVLLAGFIIPLWRSGLLGGTRRAVA